LGFPKDEKNLGLWNLWLSIYFVESLCLTEWSKWSFGREWFWEWRTCFTKQSTVCVEETDFFQCRFRQGEWVEYEDKEI
jgi:hypothetical protein